MATNRTPTVLASSKPTEGKKTTDPNQRSYAQIAASNSANNIGQKTWAEVTIGSQREKITAPSLSKVEPEKERVIF